jgi:hypothetical protein
MWVNTFLGMVILTSCLSVRALAQDVTGTIVGIVKDTSGGFVPGATITVINLGTNAARTTTSAGEGACSIRSLPIGVYDLKAEKHGFKEFR